MATTKKQSSQRLGVFHRGGRPHVPRLPCADGAMPLQGTRKARAPATDGIVRVSHETKGRKGKGVTVIKGLALDAAALAAWASS
jgi:translation initiation factor 1